MGRGGGMGLAAELHPPARHQPKPDPDPSALSSEEEPWRGRPTPTLLRKNTERYPWAMPNEKEAWRGVPGDHICDPQALSTTKPPSKKTLAKAPQALPCVRGTPRGPHQAPMWAPQDTLGTARSEPSL